MFDSVRSPVILSGDEHTAYRDPAAVYHNGWFYLFFTYITEGDDGLPYSRVAWSKSRDFVSWTRVRPFTPLDRSLDFGSPGDIVRFGGRWVLCLQTYPRPHGERYGNEEARLWTMQSNNLEEWDEPVLLRVKGPSIPVGQMGRMIDPYLFRDKDLPGKWWCFFKQNGLAMSYSFDLKNWTFVGNTLAGENPCVIVDRDEYALFYSPKNGVGIKRSTNLHEWRDVGLLTLGQKCWPWAQGRITAGFVLDLRGDSQVGKAIMFFHGSRYTEEDPRGGFDTWSSIGFAWSDDLEHWSWVSSKDELCESVGTSAHRLTTPSP